MKASNEIKEFIKSFEGLRLQAYRCAANVLTIGYGHTEGVVEGMLINKYDAESLFNKDVLDVENRLNPFIKSIKLNQNQYDAVLSLVYNIGIGNFSKSKVYKEIITNRDSLKIWDYFMSWIYGGDGSHNKIDDDCDGIVDEPGERKRLEGLVRRREAERNLYFKK